MGDRATGTRVLEKLYEQMRDKPVQVDLDVLWSELGVYSEGQKVRINERARFAAIRRAITGDPRSERAGAGMRIPMGLVSSRAFGQEKNEVGLVIGATVTPGRSFATGNTSSASFNASLALGAEYDRRFFGGERVALSAGADFLASPLDVKISNPPPDLIGQYAYIFLTPHVRLKFNGQGLVSPWVLLGGGYARFLETRPTAASSFVPGTNTGALVYGGGVDTRTILRVFHIPIGFRAEVRDFYSGSPKYNQLAKGDLQHNVVFTGGLLIKF